MSIARGFPKNTKEVYYGDRNKGATREVEEMFNRTVTKESCPISGHGRGGHSSGPREEVMNWVLQLKGLTAGGSLPKKVVATETKVTTLDPMQVLIAMQTMMREERDQTMQLQREKEQQEREERERLMQQQM